MSQPRRLLGQKSYGTGPRKVSADWRPAPGELAAPVTAGCVRRMLWSQQPLTEHVAPEQTKKTGARGPAALPAVRGHLGVYVHMGRVGHRQPPSGRRLLRSGLPGGVAAGPLLGRKLPVPHQVKMGTGQRRLRHLVGMGGHATRILRVSAAARSIRLLGVRDLPRHVRWHRCDPSARSAWLMRYDC